MCICTYVRIFVSGFQSQSSRGGGGGGGGGGYGNGAAEGGGYQAGVPDFKSAEFKAQKEGFFERKQMENAMRRE